MSNKSYNNGKNFYSSKDNSFSAKVMRAVYKKEYLDSLEKNSSTTPNHSKHYAKKNNNTFNIKKFFTIIVVILFLIVFSIVLFFGPYLKKAILSYEEGLDTTRIDIAKVPHIYDRNGNLICVMYGYYDNGQDNFQPTYSSVYTPLTSLPNYIGNAFTAIEDESFYDNSGISINRLAYATFNYLVNGDSSFGGSTITQQLVKVATGENERSPSRKAKEIGSALYITDNWSKDKILGSYINLVYYGNGAYGIYEASLTYFNTEPENLNIAQAAILASLPNSPDGLNPYASDSKKEKLFKRQKLVLQKMLELNLISTDEYNEAYNFNIEFSNGSKRIIKNDPAVSQYLNVAFKEVKSIVMSNYSCSDSEAIDLILNGNASITLNIDVNLQKNIYNVASSSYSNYTELELGGVLTSKSGEVLAVITTRNDSEVDHAYSMLRQTGSSIKPITVYGPAFDLGILTPTSKVDDCPVSVTSTNGKVWNVQNASRTYRGIITAKDAIAYSLNTVAVTTLEKVTISKSYEYAKSFGITSLTKDDLYYPALGLGGLTYGISPFEMAQAYNVFNNDGLFRSISTINTIKINDKTISKDKNEHQVISQSACNMIKESMNAVARYGTGKTANLSYTTTYIKTGTSSSNYDLWTCGFTNDVTFCLWAGYDKNKTVDFYNVNEAWKNIMNTYYNK